MASGPARRAVARICSRTSALTTSGRLNARDTVDDDTPHAWAIE
jgi:hypothetical protein